MMLIYDLLITTFRETCNYLYDGAYILYENCSENIVFKHLVRQKKVKTAFDQRDWFDLSKVEKLSFFSENSRISTFLITMKKKQLKSNLQREIWETKAIWYLKLLSKATLIWSQTKVRNKHFKRKSVSCTLLVHYFQRLFDGADASNRQLCFVLAKQLEKV